MERFIQTCSVFNASLRWSELYRHDRSAALLWTCNRLKTETVQQQKFPSGYTGCTKNFKALPQPHFEARSTIREELSSIYLSGLINQAGLLRTLLMQSSAGLTHIYVEICMWHYLVTPPSPTALQFWLMKKKDLRFVCHTNCLCFQSATYISPYEGILQTQECGVDPLSIQQMVGMKLHTSAEVCIVQCERRTPHEGTMVLITSDKKSTLRFWGTQWRVWGWPLHEKELNRPHEGMSIQTYKPRGDMFDKRQKTKWIKGGKLGT